MLVGKIICKCSQTRVLNLKFHEDKSIEYRTCRLFVEHHDKNSELFYLIGHSCKLKQGREFKLCGVKFRLFILLKVQSIFTK